MTIQWTADLVVGINSIDTQHRELFLRVNSLLDVASGGNGNQKTKEVILFLCDQVMACFSLEEKFMAQYRYPLANCHQVEHDRFIEDLTHLTHGYDAKGASTYLVMGIQRRVCNWLIDHIDKSDRALGNYLKARL